MRNLIRNSILNLGLIASLTFCATGSNVNISKVGSDGLKLPPLIEREYANGLKVIFIKDSTLPKMSITALVKAGSVQDPQSQRGLNYLTASLLDEGSAKHNSSEIAERMEYLGGDIDINADDDFTTIKIKGLSYTRNDLADAFFEILLTPQFPEKELQRIQKYTVNQIQKEEDEPSEFVNLLFNKTVFGHHPYAYPVYGTSETVSSIKRKDVLAHYLKFYNPQNISIAIVGDIDDEFIKNFESKATTWSSGDTKEKIIATNKEVESALKNIVSQKSQISFLSKKSLVQTQIRFGQVFIERNHPDFLKLRLANMAFGGAFASRLNQKIRDDLALTYGISSYIDAKKQSGMFAMTTFSRNEKVGEIIQASFKEFKEFQKNGITENELLAAKSVVIGQFPRAVETLDALAFNLLALRYYGISDTYLTNFNKTVQSYSLLEVNDVIKRYFEPEKLQIVVFGQDKVIDQLKTISPEVAQVKMVSKNWRN